MAKPGAIQALAAEEKHDREQLLGMIDCPQAKNAALAARAKAADDEAGPQHDIEPWKST